ncbi:MAG TPA: sodium-translocating pyrophosphatase [Candidatus Hydrogenedentes bacterium]|nr:sodium-translocating pyrophosphatase [Candidatus Hydrogenedentota bacterium]HOS02395.1 sodium-translocating pyrophosphatase [Candidatus Hydrogenedentota bacterium]
MLLFVMAISVLGLFLAAYLAHWVLGKETGTGPMRMVSDAIREGAEAFLSRQNKTIALLSIVLAVGIFLVYSVVAKQWETAIYTTVGFLTGAFCSGLAGYIGMFVSIRANIRTAQAARSSLNSALQIALRGGAVSGLMVVAMSLLGVGGFFGILASIKGYSSVWFTFDPSAFASPEATAVMRHLPFLIVGYGFGASFVALFAQLGGGIYTKAADVGADLVGKVETGIPEDDPRNPAVIADLVGDNVGDCAGRGADLFESTAAENIGAMILGLALWPVFGFAGLMFPLIARAFGLIASIFGIMSVKCKETDDPMRALNRGYYITAALAMLGFAVSVFWLLRDAQGKVYWDFLWCGFIGVANSMAFLYITQYYTEYKYGPVKEIARASLTGPATNIISGMAVALECTALPVLSISLSIFFSYHLGAHALPNVEGAGLYGTAVATMGMLSTCAYILAMDTFGPITDNAGGIIEMSDQPKEVRDITDRLDAVGNTTKALTKGYAIGSAALAAFLLFSAYLDEVGNLKIVQAIAKLGENPLAEAVEAARHKAWVSAHIVDLAKPEVFIGGLIGAMMVFLFSALAIRAVSKAAQSVITEVRRQFKERPGIMAGTEKPDYARCVDIVTVGALKAMVLPGAVVVLTPIIVGLLFRPLGIGPEVVGGLLMVGTIAGILMATMLNNGGGAWDNAKKYVEMGVHGGKGSEAHKAAVVGDTVGDPFKDTAGPSIHVLIKLLATITLVLIPLFI